MRRLSSLAIVVAVSAALVLFDPGTARAQPAPHWLITLEAPGALPLDAPQDSWFGPGGMPAAALYRALSSRFLVGARLRVGVLANGDAPGGGLMDPGVGGVGSLTLSGRLRPLADAADPARGTGLWLDLAGGAAMTGDLVRPTFEVGIGWDFAVGPVNLGPSVRYLHIYQPDSGSLDGRDAHIGLVGVELGLLDRRAQALPPPAPPPPAPVVRAPPPPRDSDGDGLLDPDDKCPHEAEDKDGYQDSDGCPDPDNDGDGIADKMDSCPDEAEVENGVDDQDGCPDEGLFQVVEDRIVLEERVLFDKDRARVKHAGRRVLKAIIAYIDQHPEWSRVIIEGHTDERGPAAYNQQLSEERARRVEKVMLELGVDPAKIQTKGYGESRPRDKRHTEEAWERNRRVEFVLIREHKEPVQDGKPAAPATDAAPGSDAPATPDGAPSTPDAAPSTPKAAPAATPDAAPSTPKAAPSTPKAAPSTPDAAPSTPKAAPAPAPAPAKAPATPAAPPPGESR